ncbi:hypothetical protein ACLOJK_002500 [Asimina triloba]
MRKAALDSCISGPRLANGSLVDYICQIGKLFGPEFLLKLYLAGAIGGSVFYLVHKAISSSKGASGAVNAIVLLDIFLFPKAVCYVNFFIPVPAMLLGVLFIGKDVLDMMRVFPYSSAISTLGLEIGSVVSWNFGDKPFDARDKKTKFLDPSLDHGLTAASQEKLTWGVLRLLLSHGLGLEKDGSKAVIPV